MVCGWDNWNKPKNWYNQMRLNVNFWHNKLVTPIVNPKFDNPKFQNLGFNTNGNAQLKKLQLDRL
jgi:hypothetical protein